MYWLKPLHQILKSPHSFFVALVDGWRPQIKNNTKTFILDVAMVFDTSLWNNY